MQRGTAAARHLTQGLVARALATSIAPSAGCGGTASPQPPPVTRYSGAAVVLTSQLAGGQGVSIGDVNGSLHVMGDPNATMVTATMTPFALAGSQSDADLAIADVAQSFTIMQHPQPFTVIVSCGQAAADHGSAQKTQTGCDLVVTVPAGSKDAPIIVGGQTGTGDIVAEGITEPASNGSGGWQVQSGNLTLNIAGTVFATVKSGSIQATLPATYGSYISLDDNDGDVTLKLPANFTCDSLGLHATRGSVTVGPGFTNGVTAQSNSVGLVATGVHSIEVDAMQGNVTLAPQ